MRRPSPSWSIWRGGGEIPAAARAFISEAMLSWTDHARWDESAFTCAWRIEAHAFTEAVGCQGTNRFLEDGDGTLLQIRGALVINASKLKGVPRLLSGTVSKTVEEVLGGKIKPNLGPGQRRGAALSGSLICGCPPRAAPRRRAVAAPTGAKLQRSATPAGCTEQPLAQALPGETHCLVVGSTWQL